MSNVYIDTLSAFNDPLERTATALESLAALPSLVGPQGPPGEGMERAQVLPADATEGKLLWFTPGGFIVERVGERWYGPPFVAAFTNAATDLWPCVLGAPQRLGIMPLSGDFVITKFALYCGAAAATNTSNNFTVGLQAGSTVLYSQVITGTAAAQALLFAPSLDGAIHSVNGALSVNLLAKTGAPGNVFISWRVEYRPVI